MKKEVFKMKEKILLDTSAYEEIDLSIIPEEFELFTTVIEQNEILVTSNAKKRQKLIDKYESAHNAKIPLSLKYEYCQDNGEEKWLVSSQELMLEEFVFKGQNLGCAKFGNGDLYKKILGYMNEIRPDKNHVNDALIGQVAIKNGLLLISKDKLFREAVMKLDGKAESLSEFNKRL